MPKKRRSRRFGRFRRGHKGKRDNRFPLAYAPAIVVPAAKILFGNGLSVGVIPAFQSGDLAQISNALTMTLPYETIGYASWDNTWNFGVIGRNLGLILGGMAVDKIATMTGLNSKMRRIPIVGRYLKV